MQTDEGKSDKPGTYYTPDSVSKFMGASPDCIHELMNAAKDNNLVLAKKLLDDGCDVNGKIEVGANIWESPLLCGVGHKDSEMAILLLKYGADPAQDLGRGMNPFHCAAGASTHQTFLLLLDRCKDVNILNASENHKTPLAFAIAEGKLENVKSLIKRGAKIDPDSLNGMSSPLADACVYNQLMIFKFLLNQGAKVNALYSSENEDCMPCLKGITVLHQLVDLNSYSNHNTIKDFLDVLIKYKPDMNIESDYGLTALEHACYDNDTILVDWLIAQGSKLETDDYSALHCAAMLSNYKMVEFLLKKGANPNSKTKEGNSPLLVSYNCCGDGFGEGITTYDRIKTTRVLIAYGANPFLKNNNNESFFDLCKGNFKREVCDSVNINNR
ncbi:MAG: ankyrin repeat domain-containing protein [Bacteroidota bacterium]